MSDLGGKPVFTLQNPGLGSESPFSSEKIFRPKKLILRKFWQIQGQFCETTLYFYFKHQEKKYQSSVSSGGKYSPETSKKVIFPSISKSSSNASTSSCRPMISKSRNVSFQENLVMNSNVVENYDYTVRSTILVRLRNLVVFFE